MNENYLSQGEIDVLLGKSSKIDEIELGDVEKDIIGEVGNISMSTAATTLSSILNRKVLITTPRVSWIPFKQIIEECSIPKVVADIEFKEGLEGNNLLMVDESDASVIADLMMGGDGKVEAKVLSELELSAVAEAMNQMIGSASTAMATMLGKTIDILPPTVSLWNSNENYDYKNLNPDTKICKIAFDLNVEELIQSEIMQIFAGETVLEIANLMLGDSAVEDVDLGLELPADPEPIVIPPAPEMRFDEPVARQQVETVTVQKPVFNSLNSDGEPKKAPRNLDLIMDVPLEFSVVLGRTKRTIKDVLSLSNGSVVELNKLADEPLEIYVNGKHIAQGEVVVINENFGIRITNIVSAEQRVQKLK